MDLRQKRHLQILIIRAVAIILFLYTSVTISWYSLSSFVLLLGIIYTTTSAKKNQFTFKTIDLSQNPLKGKPKATYETLDRETLHQVHFEISNFCTYDASNTASIERFSVISQNTHCLFAKKAQIWGSPDWTSEDSVKDNVARIAPTFFKFSLLCGQLGLDGFMIELPGSFGSCIEDFSKNVFGVLSSLADIDPQKNDCMKLEGIDKPHWVFRFHRETFFITTFAPCYPENSARYAFQSDHCYILFQPEISFAHKDIPADRKETNWDNPKNVRDRIRVAFRNAGREYRTFNPGRPIAYEIVKPLDYHTDHIEWWKNAKHDKLKLL